MSTPRRTFLRAILPTTAAVLAGCLGNGGVDGATDAGNATPTDTGMNGTDTPTDTGTANSTPTEDGAGGGDGTATPTESSGPASTAVAIKNFAYSPRRLSVDVGTTVTWTNEDDAPHDVVGKQFNDSAVDWEYDSGTFGKGGTTSFTFNSAGAYEYYCSVHGKSKMCGVVVVGDADDAGQLPCE